MVSVCFGVSNGFWSNNLGLAMNELIGDTIFLIKYIRRMEMKYSLYSDSNMLKLSNSYVLIYMFIVAQPFTYSHSIKIDTLPNKRVLISFCGLSKECDATEGGRIIAGYIQNEYPDWHWTNVLESLSYPQEVLNV